MAGVDRGMSRIEYPLASSTAYYSLRSLPRYLGSHMGYSRYIDSLVDEV